MQRSTSSSSVETSCSVNSNRSASSQSTTSTCGMSTISLHASRYADDHYPLINTIHPEIVPDCVPKDHSVFYCARQMAQIHNTVIRGLNASWNYAALVKTETQQAADFLRFNQQLFTMLDHHHKVEDDFLFPAIESMLHRPGAMEENTKEHASFAEGLAIFKKYIFQTKPSEFNGVTLQHIIESFAPTLVQNLHDEIPMLMSLHVLDSAALLKTWKKAGRRAAKHARLYTSGPLTLGCQDKTFTIDSAKPDFPEMSWLIEAVVRNWHSRKNAGAWVFCPSDLSGQRRQVTTV
ncbi:hypothetical protein EDD37DRAFT_316928 [Exophiala viscosa]|uniref:Hemerythrin-like domain-containing protein n=1 Tax=Exophiala viscosa TaxID=2486360 RepID=A0AAN6DWD6_9EURO|nr:hypothetical protein EDD36DRAFT_243683 [Exophiala viscosa]KAI1625751.1 hypothetical protein EDD37DRAFT_316928 [Exophiala viscosa]